MTYAMKGAVFLLLMLHYCLSSAQTYAELKDELDSGYVPTVNGKLYFKYVEKYNQPTGATLNYKVYDFKRNVVASSTLPKVYGINLYPNGTTGTINLAGLTADEWYILEVINDKGEVKFLRFQYKN